MGIETLHDVMNRLVATPLAVSARGSAVSDIERFRAQDDLFNQLYKIWLDAQSNRARIIKREGPHSPLAEMAEYQCSSAQAAWQTRLIELQEREKETQDDIALHQAKKEEQTRLKADQAWDVRQRKLDREKAKQDESLFQALLLSLLLAQGYDRPYPPPHLRYQIA